MGFSSCNVQVLQALRFVVNGPSLRLGRRRLEMSVFPCSLRPKTHSDINERPRSPLESKLCNDSRSDRPAGRNEE